MYKVKKDLHNPKKKYVYMCLKLHVSNYSKGGVTKKVMVKRALPAPCSFLNTTKVRTWPGQSWKPET